MNAKNIEALAEKMIELSNAAALVDQIEYEIECHNVTVSLPARVRPLSVSQSLVDADKARELEKKLAEARATRAATRTEGIALIETMSAEEIVEAKVTAKKGLMHSAK